MSFHVKFDILEYKEMGLLPSLKEYIEHDEIINYLDFEKGNVDLCVWKKYVPTQAEIASPEFREREVTRVLKTGAWVAIKDTVVWLPPNYYQRLQYGKAGSDDFEFRLKRLKHVYFKLWARKHPKCMGTFTVKNRQDGETTESMGDCLWECADGNMINGQIGLQSKTRDDAENPCWLATQTLWQAYPKWLKDEIYSDFTSGQNIAEKLKFMRDSDEENGVPARNVLFKYYPAVYNAMDGKSNMKKCVLDEVLKWVECDFGDTLVNYKKFIMPGFERRGMFDMFSSPADKDCQSYKDGFALWENSNPDDMDLTLPLEERSTTSRIFRYYSNPLEGILGAYDKWGDADPQRIYDHIMKERKATPKDKRLAEVRAFPLTEEEMWGSLEAASIWSNTEGIAERKLYLAPRRFKYDYSKEPVKVYGNLERIEGHIDGDVQFRPADTDKFDLQKARFCISHFTDEDQKMALKYNSLGKPMPPVYVENCLGLDPFNHRYYAKDKSKQSHAAMVNRRFRNALDTSKTAITRCPTLIYDCRPTHQEIMFEDALKAAVFNRALIQYENRNDKFANFAEDRGYSDWLLPEIGASKDSVRKGDAPTGKGTFLDEGIGLIDAATNKPLNENDRYDLEYYWFTELLSAYLRFDPKNTQVHNLVMADIQALMGIVKITHKKERKKSPVNAAVLDFVLGN